MEKIKIILIYYYNYLITPKIRLLIKILRIIFTLITLVNGSPDLCTYIDYIIKNELENPEVENELELTEKQKKWLKVGCIVATIVFSIFMVYVLKNYNIQPENSSSIMEIEPAKSSEQLNSNLCNARKEDIVALNENELDNILNASLDEYEDLRVQYEAIRIQSVLAEEAIMKSNIFAAISVENTAQENFDKAVNELKTYIEENKNNRNLLKLPKFLELERKVSIAYSILNKGKME